MLYPTKAFEENCRGKELCQKPVPGHKHAWHDHMYKLYIYIYKLSIYKNLWSMSPWCGIYFHDPIALLVTPQVHYSDPFGGTLQASLFKREPCRT